MRLRRRFCFELVATVLAALAVRTLRAAASALAGGVPAAPGPARPALRFVDIPESGAAFVTVLRNFLPECAVKGFGCPAKGRPHPAGVDPRAAAADVACGGALLACAPAGNETDLQNAAWPPHGEHAAVVMLRDPAARLLAHWARDAAGREPRTTRDIAAAYSDFVEGCLREPDPAPSRTVCARDMGPAGRAVAATKALAGIGGIRAPSDDDHAMARRRLFSEAAFFGIAERFAASACVFHCELGGTPGPNEAIGAGDDDGFSAADWEALSVKAREHLDDILSGERKLYREALERFEERARRCGCEG